MLFNNMQKLITNTSNFIIKIKNHYILSIATKMAQKIYVGFFKWVENISQFSKDFLENYNDHTDEGYLLRLMFNILKNTSLSQ